MSDYYAGPVPPPSYDPSYVPTYAPAPPGGPPPGRPPRGRWPRRGRAPSLPTVGAALCSLTNAAPGLLAVRAGLLLLDSDDDLLFFVALVAGPALVVIGALMSLATLAVPLMLLLRAPGARGAAFTAAAFALALGVWVAVYPQPFELLRRVAILCAAGAVGTVALLLTPRARADF